MEIFQNHLQPLINFLHLHPYLAGAITFLTVFSEAMAVIGVIVPGSVTMTAIGVLMGSGVISLTANYLLAICGAILGDYLSYLIGVHYKNRLRRIWPFKKYPNLLVNGEKFFRSHGGKSVFIGRFFGPMRAMIPMIAGMLKMPLGRFLLAAIPSASIWAVAYITPGVVLGALSLRLPPKIATQFLLWAILLVVVVWAFIWLTQLFFKRLCQFLDLKIKNLWLWLKTQRFLKWIPKVLAAEHRSDDHKQLAIFMALIITASLFTILLFSVRRKGILISLNEPLYYLLQSIRTVLGDKIMLVFTELAEPKALVIAQAFFIIWLVIKRQWHRAVYALAIVGLLFLSVDIFKIWTHNPRPLAYTAALTDYSFPSGHVAFSIGIYGFLAMLISEELKNKLRWLPYLIVFIISFLAALSRLYLGAHWLTDVVGGTLLGTTLIFLITILYRRHQTHKASPLLTASVAFFTFSIILFSYTINVFHKELRKYNILPRPHYSIELKNWQNQNAAHLLPVIPLYRDNRLGHPTEAFNLQWVGSDLDDIENDLTAQGWESYSSRLNVRELLHRLTMRASSKQRVPIIPQLYSNRPEVLLLTKNGNGEEPMLILRLWDSNIIFKNGAKQLWLGSIDYLRQDKNHKAKIFNGSASALIPYLKNFYWKKIHVPFEKQPFEMRNLEWNGNLLLIDEKN